MTRNTWKVGDYLAIDDESGLTHYASEMVKDWDGSLRHKDNLDGRHPQLDVRARKDPRALMDVRTRADSASGGDFFVQEEGLFKIVMEDSSGSDFGFLMCETITVR